MSGVFANDTHRDMFTRVSEAVMVAFVIVNYKIGEFQLGCRGKERLVSGMDCIAELGGQIQGKDGLVGDAVSDLEKPDLVKMHGAVWQEIVNR